MLLNYDHMESFCFHASTWSQTYDYSVWFQTVFSW